MGAALITFDDNLSNDKDIEVRTVEKDINKQLQLYRLRNPGTVTCVNKNTNIGYTRLNYENNKAYVQIDIDSEALYKNHQAVYASNKGIAWTYRELFHEFKHADMYNEMAYAINHNKSLSHEQQAIYIDDLLSYRLPSYFYYIYESRTFEKQADLSGVQQASEYFKKSWLYKSSGINFDQLIVDTTNNKEILWYGERPVNSISDICQKLNDGLLHDRICTNIPLFGYNNNDLSLKLCNDKSLKNMLEKCSTLSDLRHGMIYAVHKVQPDDIMFDAIREGLSDYVSDITDCTVKSVHVSYKSDDKSHEYEL